MRRLRSWGWLLREANKRHDVTASAYARLMRADEGSRGVRLTAAEVGALCADHAVSAAALDMLEDMEDECGP